MPLREGSSDDVVSDNIAQLIRDGYPKDQATAIAYRKAGRSTAATDGVQLDLGTGDVHTPSSEPARDAAGNARMTDVDEMGVALSELDAAKRNALKPGQFALPSQRKYPIHDAAHTRNAAARLAQAKKAGKISDGDYRTARAAIRRAAKRFGIHTELKDTLTPPSSAPRSIHVRADLAQGGSLHVRHMADGLTSLYLPPVPLKVD